MNTQGPFHTVLRGDWGVTVQNTTNRLLNDLKEAKELPSDYALANLLDVESSAIGNYRKGRSHMREDLVVLAARMLGLPAAPLLSQVAADRSRYPEVAKVWREAAKSLARAK